ncbi:MAG: class I SAM-dependent methyltransferase [Thaumarchaeota archaeon]|nr:class I SAM-dependent methyltransferase [Nitrososphaerota archaeon]
MHLPEDIRVLGTSSKSLDEAKVLDTENPSRLPDYETYDYAVEWRDKAIEDSAEKAIIRGWLSQGDSALELGGGYGRMTRVLRPYFKRLTMVDGSRFNLNRARKAVPGAELVRADLTRLPFRDNEFEVIVTIRTIHHIQDLRGIFGEIRRVAKPRATLIMSVPNTALSPFRWVKENELVQVSAKGHRIFAAPLISYTSAFGLQSARGTGMFENFLGRKLNGLGFLHILDVVTAPLWRLKPNLFLKFQIDKN